MERWIQKLCLYIFKQIFFFVLPIGLTIGFAILIDIGVETWQSPPQSPIEFGVRKQGLNSSRSCLEIYENEPYETFEKMCRIVK